MLLSQLEITILNKLLHSLVTIFLVIIYLISTSKLHEDQPFAEIDDVLTERLKVELATASVKVATAELIFGNVLTSLNISTASTTMDP